MEPKSLQRKSPQENGDVDIVTKPYFPRAHTEETKGLVIILIALLANFSMEGGMAEE
jgi:hypothetical protein